MQMILEKIRAIIAEKLEIDKSSISANSTFEELNADSLYVVEIIMAIEEEFEIEIDDTEGLKRVSDLAAFVEERLI